MVTATTQLPTGTVTFLFTDIEGSTRLLQRVGAHYSDVLDLHHRIMRDAIAARDGIVVSTEGDSFFAVFASARAAADAAVEAQTNLTAAEWPPGAVVRVRMGLHTGLGELGGDNYIGLDVHVGARVSSAGHGGQIVLSRATEGLIGEPAAGVELRDLGTHLLKDIERPVHLYQLSPPGRAADFPPLRTIDARPNNLPVQTTSFVGREREAAEVEDLLTHQRLVTLTGPGGVGKTRLALHVAARLISHFEDGVRYVSLGPVTDADLVEAEVAAAVEMPEQPDVPLSEALVAHLAEMEVLLVLDNFEHLLAATPALTVWLERAPGVYLLVTTRALLRVRGEREYQVPPLADPQSMIGTGPCDAVELFHRRALEVDPSFELTPANGPTIEAIVDRLDRLPLAIELAASRLNLFTADQLLERLEGRLDVLKGGRDLPDRQRTLRGSIEWSIDMLDDDEHTTLRMLSAFRSGFTVDAAEAVIGDAHDVADALAGLLDQSLVRTTPMRGRFEMLRTIRDHVESTMDSDELDGARSRHAEWARSLALEGAARLDGIESVVWYDRFDLEHDNLRAALGWFVESGAFEPAVDLIEAVWRYWQVRGRFAEGREAVASVLALPAASERTIARARALTIRASLAYWQGEIGAASALYEEALGIAEDIGDEEAVTDALYNLSFTAGFDEETGELSDDGAAEELAQRAIERMRASGDRRRLAMIAVPRSLRLLIDGRLDDGEDLLREALDFFGQEDDLAGRGVALSALAAFAARQGDDASTARYITEAMAIYEPIGDVASMAAMAEVTGLLEIRNGRAVEGVMLVGAAGALRNDVGYGLTTLASFIGDPADESKAYMSEAEFTEALAAGAELDVWETLERVKAATGLLAGA